ncbi:MAG TPA: amino acid adenylation domain-containing protein, partial [Longimicrobiaceae bacterium]|nr:amino acid adenylation domain-containing protein [Longimicrobiaceae bacterium]
GGGRSLSYRELLAAAERVAAGLRTRGVGPEDRVGLLLERGTDLAVALLGVLQAGAAFVPLDPAYPAERLGFLLEDSGAAVVVTHSSMLPRLPAGAAGALCVDRLPEAGSPADPAAGGALPESLAYVIYTSGSTGRPKGAMVTHRSLLCYAEAMRERLQLTPADRILQFASPGFDVMVEEVFPAWLCGAAVVFPGADLLGTPADLVETLQAQGVTGLELPTAYWHEWVQLLADDGARLPASVRFVIVGGERIVPDRLQAWARTGVPLVHVFGLTETTVTSTTFGLAAGEDGSVHPNLPLGHALPNVALHVLDADREPVPDGLPGELFVGGDGVARGYLGRPALTAERFVPDPFGEAAGGRLYRTGDRVRRIPSAALEFLGRMDDQVKVRGFRVEPAEIEVALAEHPAIRQAAVAVREEEAGARRLVAYVVAAPECRDGSGVSLQGLREYLGERLPEHMVPSAFVVVDAIPLTANGKVDRRALPDPAGGKLGGGEAYLPPRDEVEATLARIWGEVLRVERVGIHDNFFELGGDSILSIQIVSRARRAGLSLRPRQIFLHPTLARLSGVVGTPAAAARVDREPLAGEASLLPVQCWFFEQEVPDRAHWNMPLLLELRRPLDPELLRGALREVLLHHDALRFRYAPATGGSWTQRYAPPADDAVPLERADLAGIPAPELAGEIERRCAAAQAGLDLERGPLLRALLLEPGNGAPSRLLLAAHHLVVDGVSWRIVVEDLQTAYEQLERGERPWLPPRTTSFGEWAARLAEHAARGGFDGELEHWMDEPRRMTRLLPVDAPGPNPSGAARTVSVALEREETQALLQEVPAAYRTRVDDVLLTALARAFEPWTGDPCLLVELEGHGREELFEDVDLSRTVGWFTAMYPVLLDLRGAHGTGEALKRVKEQLRGVAARGIGYGALRYLGPSARTREGLASLPAPQVGFNYLGQVDPSVSGASLFGLAAEPAGPGVDPRAPRPHLLDVNAVVEGGRLRVEWTYGARVHRRDTVEALAGRYLAELRRLLEHCRSGEAGGCTPSDFPLAGLDQAGVDALVGSGRGVEDVYRLTPTQEGILFETLYAPESGVYVAQYHFGLGGVLDEAAFERAWRRVLERHSSLRTGFAHEAADPPLQVVWREVDLPVLREDLRGLAQEEQREHLDAHLAADRARGFDLAHPPLMRLALFRTGDAAWELVWTLHQILLDGWSLPVVFREVLEGYDAFAAGGDPARDAAPPYRDYVAWLARQDPSRTERFWRESLAGFPAPTPVGTAGGARPAAETGPERVECTLPEELSAALHAAARRGELTVNTLLQGAWALLLSRHAGEEDVVFGSTVSGRPPEVAGVEEMVGLFINTLPVRVRVVPGSLLLPWLRSLQERQAEARDHEHTPLAQVQRWSEVPAGTPLFESLLAYENYPFEELLKAPRALRVERRGTREQTNYPLGIAVVPGRALRVLATYDRACFDAGEVRRMLGQLRVALEGIAPGDGRAVGSIGLLSEAERRSLLAASRAEAVRHPPVCVHELFSAQAARTPELTAVAGRGGALTYAELERSSNRLAHRLRGRGVGPETRVGVCLERGVEMLVAVLAVLKAGGAYVPLDPSYPAERLAYTLADAGASLLLSQSGLLEALPTFAGEVVRLDAEQGAAAGEPDMPPQSGVGTRNAAYVIYTSGSTGTPKGVVVEHASLANTLLGTRDTFGLAAGEVFPAMASYAFDIWGFEVFAPLLSGGEVRLLERETVRDVERLVEELAGADALHAVPALMREVVARVQAGPGTLPRIRRVFVGGDAVPPDLIGRMHRVFPAARTWVLYGPTEATILGAASGLRQEEDYGWQVVGRALPGVGLYVCDAGGGLLPEGVPGELWIGGAGVARGYLGRAELTAEKFVPDALGGEAGSRLYRTGDRVRRRPDGELEFLGRVDGQVKIRGFRIEPGEVEAALLDQPGVHDAVVVAREDSPGQKRLVAYVTAHEGADVSAAGLRARLSSRLPEHMVPSAFMVMGSLPQNANGKTDRRALPAPERGGAKEAYTAPRTGAETVLCAVWAGVLKTERVGVEDNFFELGGDSILSIQVVARARQQGLKLTPRQIFERPTVARLAEVAEWASPEAAAAAQGPVTGEAPLTPVQRRFFEQPGGNRSHFNQALLLRPREALEARLLARAAAALEAHHDALRLRFRQGEDGAWTQSHAAPG